MNTNKERKYLADVIDVMSEFNGHDMNLVVNLRKMVNKATNAKNDYGIMSRFYAILTILANDYIDEINDLIVEENITLTEISQEFVKQYVYDILTQVCDDNDLKIILTYCRWEQYKDKIN